MSNVNDFDRDIAEFVVGHRSPALTRVAHVVTAFGSELSLALLTAIAIGLLLWLGRRRAAAVFTVGMAGSAVLTVGVKHLFGRARPGAAFRLGPPDSSFSFPSGHTLNTTVFVLMVVLALWPVAAAPVRRSAAVLAVVLAVSVGLTRLYLGYHWATDVLGGLTIGVVWSATVALSTRASHPDDAAREARSPSLPREAA